MDFFLLAPSCFNPCQKRTLISQKILQPIPLYPMWNMVKEKWGVPKKGLASQTCFLYEIFHLLIIFVKISRDFLFVLGTETCTSVMEVIFFVFFVSLCNTVKNIKI